MIALEQITQKRLKEVINYNPVTGIFKWVVTCSNSAKKGTIASCKNAIGYTVIRIDKKLYLAHRLAFLYMAGRFPNQADHINHDRGDNKWSNIREVFGTENNKNYPKYLNNKSGVTGVHWDKRNSKWMSYIQDNKKRINLYYGKDFLEAVSKRKSAEKHYGYHENHGKEMAA